MSLHYDNSMVLKPWGMEYEVYSNGEVSIWHLHLKKRHQTSLHYHTKKTTVLTVMRGRVRVTKTANGIGLVMIERDVLCLAPGEPHSTEALEDSWLLELETPVEKTDLVRICDNYGREHKPYESVNEMIPYDRRFAFPSTEFPA